MKPILFSTAMVQAILAGNKTQTRRVAIPVKDDLFEGKFKFGHGHGWTSINYPKLANHSKYGREGDTLWVRETYTQNGLNYFRYKADWGDNKYPTGEPEGTFINKSVPVNFRGKWKPSIHMPFAACRIFLKIKSIRVERLHSISEDDAKAEGVSFIGNDQNEMPVYKDYQGNNSVGLFGAINSFASLWGKINGVENWNLNPWVWVIEFERIEKPQHEN